MAIKGRVEELPASEILQFLTQSQKSGSLRFADEHRSKILQFENGKLFLAVSQHDLPPLGEVLYQRGVIGREVFSDQREGMRWDDQVTKALEWRRISNSRGLAGDNSRTRLGSILVRRGRISQEDLDLALEPESMPDGVLEEILISDGGISQAAIQGVRRLMAPEDSLYEAVVNAKVLTREQIKEAIGCMDERAMANLLVYYGYVNKREAKHCAEQLRALRGQNRTIFRIGEFLVACGKVSQRQVEKALGTQLTKHLLLGEILVEQEILTEEEIIAAEREVDQLRSEFSPFHVLSQKLIEDKKFSAEMFAEARAEHLGSDRVLTDLLVETGKVSEAAVRGVIEDILADELCDLMRWEEGAFEFFEGFSIEDALKQEGIGRMHEFTFDVGALLLEAHYRVDELQRTAIADLNSRMVLTVAEPEKLVDHLDSMSESDRRFLHRFDGRRTIREVCSVMPGNGLDHTRMMLQVLDNGWATPVERVTAFVSGQEYAAKGEFRAAISLYEHALCISGDEPRDSVLHAALGEARFASSRSFFRRLAFNAKRCLRRVASLPGLRFATRLIGKTRVLPGVARLVSTWWDRCRTVISQVAMRLSVASEDFMIQKGFARQWWTLRARVLDPVRNVGSRPAPRIASALVVFGTVGIVLLLLGIPDPPPESGGKSFDGPGGSHVQDTHPQSLKSAIAERDLEAPIEVRPAITDNAVYVSSRDGLLRSIPIPVDGDSERFNWEAQVGEYGDLLSAPVVVDGTVLVANVRGTLHALTSEGELRWTAKFPRLEPVAPVPLGQGADRDQVRSVSVAVVGRESVYVVRVEDGHVEYQLRTGNLIEARPVVEGSRVFVGGLDNHIYCADWQADRIVWDIQVKDDVKAITRAGKYLVALIRDGSLVGVRIADGAVLWEDKKDFRPVRHLASLSDGQAWIELDGNELQIADVTTGFRRRLLNTDPALGVTRIRCAGDRYIYTARGGLIGQIDNTGVILWCSTEDLGDITGWDLNGEHLVVTSAQGRLRLFSLAIEEVTEVEKDG